MSKKTVMLEFTGPDGTTFIAPFHRICAYSFETNGNALCIEGVGPVGVQESEGLIRLSIEDALEAESA
jgi:hypothetical protein